MLFRRENLDCSAESWVLTPTISQPSALKLPYNVLNPRLCTVHPTAPGIVSQSGAGSLPGTPVAGYTYITVLSCNKVEIWSLEPSELSSSKSGICDWHNPTG